MDAEKIAKSNRLSAAIELAARAHSGQVDKAGEPYILHPLRVMLSMQTEDERIVAVLHDVIEDTPIDTQDLMNLGLSAEQIEAIVVLTRPPGEDYERFIEHIATNPLAKAVKLADIADNMSPARAASRPARLTDRYIRALAMLGAVKGEADDSGRPI